MKKLFSIGILFLVIGFCGITANAQIDGCKKYLGRAGQFMCETQPGYDQCVKKLKAGGADFCLLVGKPETAIRRISAAEAKANLDKRGCLRNGSAFECSDLAAYYDCLSYKNFGAVGSCVKSDPKAIKGSLSVYAVGADGNVRTVRSTNGKWGNWKRVGFQLFGGMDACSPNPGKVIAMFNGLNDAPAELTESISDYALSKEFDGAKRLSSLVGSAPSVTCSVGNKVWMFVRGYKNGAVYYAVKEDDEWQPAYPLLQGTIGIVGQDPAIELLKGETLGKGYEPKSNGNYRVGGWLLGGEIKGSPDATTINGAPLVVVRGMDDQVWLNRQLGANWTGFQPANDTKVSSDPAVVYLSKRKAIWIFARGMDNKLWASQITNLNTMKASFWVRWSDVQLAGSPDVASWDGNRVDVVARAADGSVLHFWRDDSEGLVKKPQLETIPNGKTIGDPTVVGVQW